MFGAACGEIIIGQIKTNCINWKNNFVLHYSKQTNWSVLHEWYLSMDKQSGSYTPFWVKRDHTVTEHTWIYSLIFK